MNKWIMAGLVAGTLLVTHNRNAAAGGFAEFEVGPVIPLGDDDYDRAVETSFKLGVRVGALELRDEGVSLGADVGLDWTPLTDDFEGPFTSASFHRFRAIAALRAASRVGKKGVVTARFGVGLDYARASFRTEIFGTVTEAVETDSGIALDPSLAFQADLGRVMAGIKIGFPIGIHDQQGNDFDLDYTSVDLDLLFLISGTM